MTHDEAKSLGQAALERLDKISGRLEWEHAIHDLATGLDMLHGMVVRLEDALKVSAEQVRVEMERRKRADEKVKRVGAFSTAGLEREFVVRRENNALRKNNERLTKENVILKDRVRKQDAALASTGQMAAHYKLQAQGGNYDATQEDCPGCAEQWNAALEEAASDVEASGVLLHPIFAERIRALKKP